MAAINQDSTPTFTVFPKLPAEIRDAVWMEAIPERAISLSEIPYYLMLRDIDDGLAMLENRSTPQFKSSAKTPTIFHICQESRLVALRSYELIFEGHCKSPFYFNPSADTISLCYETDLMAFMSHSNACLTEMKKIRYLALGPSIHTSLSMSSIFGQQLGIFENLESLVIQLGRNFGELEKFQVRKQLRGQWKKSEEKAGESSDGEVVMQNPDIVFLSEDEMGAMGLVTSA